MVAVAGPVSFARTNAAGQPLSLLRAREMVRREDEFARAAPPPAAPPVNPAAAPPAATPVNPAAAPVTTQHAAETGEGKEVLSKLEWARKVHPGITKLPLLPREMARQLEAEYEQYRSTTLALESMSIEKGRHQISQRRADIADRNAATQERNTNVYEKNAASAAVRARTAAAESSRVVGKNKIPIDPEMLRRGMADINAGKYSTKDTKMLLKLFGISDGKGTVSLRDKLALDAVEEIVKTKSPKGPKTQKFQLFERLNPRRGGGAKSASKDIQEALFGVEGLGGGLLGAFQPDSKGNPPDVVRAFLDLLRFVNNRGATATPDEQAQLDEVVVRNLVTVEQVAQAEAAGTITPQEKELILQVILSPEQQRELLQQSAENQAVRQNTAARDPLLLP